MAVCGYHASHLIIDDPFEPDAPSFDRATVHAWFHRVENTLRTEPSKLNWDLSGDEEPLPRPNGMANFPAGGLRGDDRCRGRHR